MKENCKNCKYWKKDYGIHCFNGWTGMDKRDGYCHFDIKTVYKTADDFCSKFVSISEVKK